MMTSKYFMNLNDIIDPPTLAFLSKRCNFEENFDHLLMKVLKENTSLMIL